MEGLSRREIEEAVFTAIQLRGTTGRVAVQDALVEFSVQGGTVAVETPGLLAAWPAMPIETRRQAANDIARRLLDARRAAANPKPGGTGARASSSSNSLIVIGVGGVVLLAALGVFIGIWSKKDNLPEVAAAAAASAAAEGAARGDEDRAVRTAAICEATRKRLYTGATLHPTDGEGWVVELWLARRGDAALAGTQAIRALNVDGKLAPTGDAELAKIEAASLEIVDAATPSLGPAWRAATLRFSGRYADAYVDAAGRARFIAFAERTAAASGAELGALFAHCARSATHEMGSWFFGSDPAGASASLLYAMGLFAEPPAVDRRSFSGSGDLDSLRSAASTLDADKLASLIGPLGGNITSLPTGSVVASFALSGPVRANSASHEVAKRLHVDGASPPSP